MWLGFVALGVIGGLALGWEKSFYGQASKYLKNRETTRIVGLVFSDWPLHPKSRAYGVFGLFFFLR